MCGEGKNGGWMCGEGRMVVGFVVKEEWWLDVW